MLGPVLTIRSRLSRAPCPKAGSAIDNPHGSWLAKPGRDRAGDIASLAGRPRRRQPEAMPRSGDSSRDSRGALEWADFLQAVFVEPVQAHAGDVAPAVVDGRRVPAVGELDQVVDRVRVAVLLERGFGDGFRDGMVLAAHDEQQRAPVVDGRVDCSW